MATGCVFVAGWAFAVGLLTCFVDGWFTETAFGGATERIGALFEVILAAPFATTLWTFFGAIFGADFVLEAMILLTPSARLLTTRICSRLLQAGQTAAKRQAAESDRTGDPQSPHSCSNYRHPALAYRRPVRISFSDL